MAALRGEAQRGVAVIVALHDLALAMRSCDRMVLLAGGRVLKAGPPSDVLQADALQAAYGVAFAFVSLGDLRLPVPLSRIGAAGDRDAR
jgi:iron complex transport system ATP-binding protein